MSKECSGYKSQKSSVETITRLRNVLRRSIGCYGEAVGLLNCEYGIISLTSDSKAILNAFQEDDIMMTFHRNMIKSFSSSDMVGTLTFISTDIFLKILTSHSIARHSVTATLALALDGIKSLLSRHSFSLSIKNTTHFKSLISSVLMPKISKFLSFPKQRVLVTLILEAYISCINSSNYPIIKVLKRPFSGDIENSQFYHGILLPVERTRDFKDFIVNKRRAVKQNQLLSVIILSCSIPKELESFEGETFTFLDVESDLEEVFVCESIQFLEENIDNIDLLCSQKVVHHRIRTFLRSRGVLVLDRLSVMFAENIATLCGTTLSPSISHCTFGNLKDISLIEFGGKEYLHFQPVGESHFGTITLHSLTDTVACEIEDCVEKSIGVCNNAMATQSLIHGGPCLYSTILSNLPHDPNNIAIKSTRSSLYELCRILTRKEMVCYDGHVWGVEQSPDRDEISDELCICKKYKLDTNFEITDATFLSDLVSTTRSVQPNKLQTDEQKGTWITENDESRVIHPTSSVIDMFDKTFQMLDVLFKSELPDT